MSHIKLTIALLTYNRGESGYFRAALEAILAQTYTNFELLVLDNHSDDKTPDIVLSYKDPRLTYVRQPPGCNGSFNFNRGLWMSRGEYFLATHDDDIMEPTMIERQVLFLEQHPDLACVATNVSLINEHGSTIQPQLYSLNQDRIFEEGDYIPTYLDEKLWLPTPTCMFKRDALVKKSGPIVRASKPRYISSGDIGILFLLNMRYSIGLLAEPLLRYRQHSGQESRNVDQSSPLVELVSVAEHLLKKRGLNIKLRDHAPSIHGFGARFRAQNLLFQYPKSASCHELRREINVLKSNWVKMIKPEHRAVDSVLPFELLLSALDLGLTIPMSGLNALDRNSANGGARRGYRDWAHLAHTGQTLFDGVPKMRKIAILGSMFTAFLLILNARRIGIEVVCCIDSSPARIGQEIFGIPVMAHAELRRFGNTIDAVILSSERDQEDAIKGIISKLTPDAEIQVFSWKELAYITRTRQNFEKFHTNFLNTQETGSMTA